jgi:guanine deaminase
MKAYKAIIINPVDKDRAEVYQDGLLVFNPDGIIEYCGSSSDCPINYENLEIHDFSDHIILPGLIDTHVHLPQYSAIGRGKGELLGWLEKYIFPLEAKFDDDEFAKEQSKLFFEDALSYGTTTMSVYCSVHPNAADISFETAAKLGARAFIGNSLMDENVPGELIEKSSLEESKKIIEKWNGNDNGRLSYILTPRYAGCCSMELLRKCSEISKSEKLLIQTHIAENREELEFISKLYPKHKNYAVIYADAGILGESTILAHGIYLNEEEQAMIKDSGATICHCPNSNRFLQSGFMPLRKYLDEGMKIALGSDIAGGSSLSMLNEAKEAIETTKVRNIIGYPVREEVFSAEEALWLATLAGAIALKIDSVTGNLIKGKEADFIILDGNEIKDKSIKNEDLLSSLIYKYSEKRVMQTFVRGREAFVTYR